MSYDLGAALVSGVIVRQSRDGLQLFQAALGRVVPEGDHTGHDLVQTVEEFSVRPKRAVPWTRSGLDLGERRIMRRPSAFIAVQVINQKLIEAEVGNQYKTV